MTLEEFKKKYGYENLTPILKQFLDIKFQNLECLLLFKVGEFYEMYFEDAIKASGILEIALTYKNKNTENKIATCGFPCSAVDVYLTKLLQRDLKVAICDQVDEEGLADKPGKSKSIVQRKITRILTPGTLTEGALVLSDKPNYLLSLVIINERAGICYVDLTTSELNLIELPASQIINQLLIIAPREIIIPKKLCEHELVLKIKAQAKSFISFLEDNLFENIDNKECILKFFNISNIKAIGELTPPHIQSLANILKYLSLTQKDNIFKLKFPKIINCEDYMEIDSTCLKNLEIVESLNSGAKATLLGAINKTLTKGGARLIYKFLTRPIIDLEKINKRLSFTEFFYQNFELTKIIRTHLLNAYDLEKICVKLQTNKIAPKDLSDIKSTLDAALSIKSTFIEKFGLDIPENFSGIIQILSGNNQISEIIKESIIDNSQINVSEGGYIKLSYHPKLKELYEIIKGGKNEIENLAELYRKDTQISALKILHNSLNGLYIELPAKSAHKITDKKYIHLQNIGNYVRYTTINLRSLSDKIINAKIYAIGLEQSIFKDICNLILKEIEALILLSSVLNTLDVFCAFAYLAKEENFTKPILTNDTLFELRQARHPVFSSLNFTSNDCSLSENLRIMLITGPNMSGKSTYLRQNALIAILAQIGSFVPASYCKIGIVDKIFTRIGAADDILNAASTFMLEMLETSSILAQATEKSIVILDELGRGTSNSDGLSIACAVLEYIHDNLKCRCLFATHYLELTELVANLNALKNYTIEIHKNNDEIIYTHKVIEGTATGSYGLHVAQLAGIPQSIIDRAIRLLSLKYG